MDLSAFSRLIYVLRDEESVFESWRKSKKTLSKNQFIMKKKPCDFGMSTLSEHTATILYYPKLNSIIISMPRLPFYLWREENW